LSEGEKEAALREYLEGQANPTVAKKDYVKNDLPWSILAVGETPEAILAKFKAGKIDLPEATRLISGSTGGLKIRHNPTGTISVKSSGQFPWCSLYADQWNKLLAVADGIHAYITANSATITAAEVANKAAKKAA